MLLSSSSSGVARGCGWQHLGAYVNLGAYYLFGIPAAVVLAFVIHIRGKGLWIGILGGAIVQTTLLLIITFSINWQLQVLYLFFLNKLLYHICFQILIFFYFRRPTRLTKEFLRND